MRVAPLGGILVAIMLHAAAPAGAAPPRPGGGDGSAAAKPMPVGAVFGRVTDKDTGEPVVGAQLSIQGTRVGASTDENGRYRIAGVPDGAQTVVVKRIGYAQATHLVTVSGGDVQVDFALTKANVTLEAVVSSVTGEERKKEVGNVTAMLSADSLMANAPILMLDQMLTARVPGVQVTFSNGYTGSSNRVRIRGINTLSGNPNPILIIDGVRVDVSFGTYQGLIPNATDRYSYGGGGGQTAGRFNDYNPEDFESMEVVKGPAAATLYGTDAANGVIVIKTKRGKAGNVAWTTFGEEGYIHLPVNSVEWNYRRWGHTANGTIRQCTLLNEFYDHLCTGDSLTKYTPFRDPDNSPVANGARKQYGVQVSGGTQQLRYFLSGGLERERGVLHMNQSEQTRIGLIRSGTSVPAPIPDEQVNPNTLAKINFRGNTVAQIGETGDVSVSVGMLQSDTRIPDPYGIFPFATLGPGSKSITNGWYSNYRPGDVYSIQTQEHTWHYTAGMTGNWRPNNILSFRGALGRDFSDVYVDNLTRFGENPNLGPGAFLSPAPLGARINGRNDTDMISADFGGSVALMPRSSLSSRTSFGVQYNRRTLFGVRVQATGLAAGGETTAGAAVVTGAEATSDNVTAGGYVEQKFGWNERLFGTVAIRSDGSSSFGSNLHTATFPKASLSWLTSEEPFFPKSRWLTSLRFRSAFGEAGVNPASTSKLSTSALISTQIDGAPAGAAYLTGIGNDNLRPERQREFEVGFDADFLGDRAHFEATRYDRRSTDALIDNPLPISTGIVSRQENLGRVRNWGYEGLLTLRLVDTRPVSFDVSFNGAVMNNKLVSANVRAGTLLSNAAAFAQYSGNKVGYPLISRFDRKIISWGDYNHDGIIVPSEILVDTALSFLGSSVPQEQLSVMPNLGMFGERLRLSAMFDHRNKFSVVHVHEINRCNFDNCIGVNDPSAPLFQQMRAVLWKKSGVAPTVDPNIKAPSNYGVYFEAIAFTRLRELSLTYTLPAAATRLLHTRNGTLMLAGRNLGLWTNYTGPDPEKTFTPGIPYAEGYADNPSLPPTRYFIARLTLGM